MRVGGSGIRGTGSSLSRRREKNPEKRTGEVRPAPASRAGNQVREPRRRRHPPAPARETRAKQGPGPGLEDRSAKGMIPAVVDRRP